jgi:hypothetical protein
VTCSPRKNNVTGVVEMEPVVNFVKIREMMKFTVMINDDSESKNNKYASSEESNKYKILTGD